MSERGGDLNGKTTDHRKPAYLLTEGTGCRTLGALGARSQYNLSIPTAPDAGFGLRRCAANVSVAIPRVTVGCGAGSGRHGLAGIARAGLYDGEMNRILREKVEAEAGTWFLDQASVPADAGENGRGDEQGITPLMAANQPRRRSLAETRSRLRWGMTTISHEANWASAVRGEQAKAMEAAISVRLDADVMAWLCGKGPGSRTRSTAFRARDGSRNGRPSRSRHHGSACCWLLVRLA